MSSNHASLDAASTDRKARLAKLASLKRKQPHQEDAIGVSNEGTASVAANKDVSAHLSGRNYDFASRGPLLGFENAPTDGKETLEMRADSIADAAHEAEARGDKEEKPLNLFTLQPKKPNWDLKRDLATKLEMLDQRTDNAIARIVRERIQSQARNDQSKLNGDESNKIDELGLLDGVKIKEREHEEEIRRELATGDPEAD